MKKKVIVVIPAFHEEKTIETAITKSKPFCDEIVVVLAKRSKDKTRVMAERLGAKIIVDNGLGKGEGMRCAIQQIPSGIIVFMDADGSHIPGDIPLLTAPIIAGKADMVIGSRLLGGSEELHGDFGKFLRMFFSMCIAQIINWRFRACIQDTQNGFRAIDVEKARTLRLTSNHTEIETEMCMKCFAKKYIVLEVPSRELRRHFGDSNIILWKHGWKYAWTVFKNLF